MFFHASSWPTFRGSAIGALMLLFVPQNVEAQYFLGVNAGPYWVATDGKRVTDLHAYGIGACLIARGPDPIGYAAHIGLQHRRFHANGYGVSSGSDRYLDLEMVLEMLAIGCEGRVALGPGKTAFFDVGPEFCILFSEEKDGIAYTRDYAVNDTITYHHATRTLFEMQDIRFRTGFSGDVRLSESLLGNFGLHGSIGGGTWSPVTSGILLGLQFSAGLLFNVQGKKRRN